MKQLPKGVKEIYHDEDDWWAILEDGWAWGVDECGVIHEETKAALYAEIKTIYERK